MMKDNGAGLRQVEFPVQGMRRRRIAALDAACSSLLEAKEAKAEAAAAMKRAEQEIQSELQHRELDGYVYVDGETKFAVTSRSKDQIVIVELKPKARKKPARDDDEQLEGG